MNERIRELAEKATVWKDANHGYTFDKQKFAELIIREYSYDCMDVTGNSEHIQFVAKKWGVEL